MKINFISYNQDRKELIKQFELSSTELTNDDEKYSYLKYLLHKLGESFFVPQYFDFEQFIDDISKWFTEDDKLDLTKEQIEDVTILNISGGSKFLNFIGLKKPLSIAFNLERTYLSFFFLPYEWTKESVVGEKIERKKFVSSLFVDNIEKYIYEYVENNFDKKTLLYASADNYYVEKFNHRYQQFFLSEREENEVLLAWLNVASIKKLAKNKDFYPKLTWYFLLTNLQTYLIGFDKKGDVLEAFDLQNKPIDLNRGIQTTIRVSEYQWNATLSNTNKYKDVSQAVLLSPEQRINYIARMNVANSGNRQRYYEYAKFLNSISGLPTSELTNFLLDYLKDSKKAIEEYSADEKLLKILQKLLKYPQSEEMLVFWYTDWKPDKEQTVFILRMLLNVAKDDFDLKKILPFHKVAHSYLIKNEKDKLNKVLLDIQYADHLIALDYLKEAEKILLQDLKILPDQTISEITPSEYINPAGRMSGPFLKIVILELLAKTQKGRKSDDFLKQAATLQPLSVERLEKLSDTNDTKISAKAALLRQILQGEDLQANTEKKDLKYSPITKEISELIKYPSIRKKGVMSGFTKWLAKQKILAHEEIKKYAEPMDMSKYPDISEIVSDLLQIFNISNLEIFIAHGEQSVGFRSYDGENPCLVIGKEHLIAQSPYFMTYNELKFAIAEEIAFLYFKFAKITASDIWRGAMDKGNFVIDTLIDILPMAGTLNTAFKSASKIKALEKIMSKSEFLSRIIQQGQNIETIADKSKNIIQMASQSAKLVGDKLAKKQDTKRDEIIAISRIMQITADRVGLLFCSDLVSAVRSIFLSSREYISLLPTVQKYGLNSLLLRKDEAGNYVNQNLAIRFASMFSFYISDEFEKISKKIVK
jgi:hypothetical protein